MKYKTILQIDDDADDCEFFCDALSTVSDAGYTAVYDAKEALAMLQGKRITPDVILLDLNMPRMNGVELLCALKENSELKDIPVIIVSTSPVSELRLQTEKLGAHDYISKPSDFKELQELLLKML